MRMHFTTRNSLVEFFQANPDVDLIEVSTDMVELPDFPDHIRGLFVRDCPNLVSLPTLPSSLLQFTVSNCPELQSLPALPAGLRSLIVLDCATLRQLLRLPRKLLKRLEVLRCGTRQ